MCVLLITTNNNKNNKQAIVVGDIVVIEEQLLIRAARCRCLSVCVVCESVRESVFVEMQLPEVKLNVERNKK